MIESLWAYPGISESVVVETQVEELWTHGLDESRSDLGLGCTTDRLLQVRVCLGVVELDRTNPSCNRL